MAEKATARSQAIAQRRNLLNIIRELEADSERMLRHAEVLRREVTRIEDSLGIVVLEEPLTTDTGTIGISTDITPIAPQPDL